MKPETWFFVTDHDGMELAAFPERDLAEAYMENMPWEIDERIITTDSTFVSATLYDETLRRAEKAEAENKSLTLANESLKGAHECDLDRRANVGAALRRAEQRAERAEAALRNLLHAVEESIECKSTGDITAVDIVYDNMIYDADKASFIAALNAARATVKEESK
jgi:hypothetical protein